MIATTLQPPFFGGQQYINIISVDRTVPKSVLVAFQAADLQEKQKAIG